MTVSRADWVRVGMRLYSSMMRTRMESQRRQPILTASRDAAVTRLLGSGLPRRSATVICGWPCWIVRWISESGYPDSTP
jgi:hypothetical protein